MEILLIKWILIFGVALFALVKAADYFTEYSEKLGRIMGIPQFLIGVTIVALGTSMPELASSIVATLQQNSSIVAGNIIGSNIANILLVGGFTALVSGIMVIDKPIIKVELPLLIAITSLLVVTVDDGKFSAIEGLILIAAYMVYVAYNYYDHKNSMLTAGVEEVKSALGKKQEKVSPILVFGLLLSLTGVVVGAKFTIDAVIEISSIMNLAPSIIAVTAVAVGTSLPELLVSYKAAKKKNFEMAVGNIIGSNIFNATVAMGIPALIAPLTIDSVTLTIAVPFLVISTILFAFSGIERSFYSFEGALYGLIYLVFIGQLFNFI